MHLVEVFLGVFIGAVTFTGSIIAYLKLSAKMKSAPLTLPGRNWLNLGALVVSAALLGWYLAAPSIWPLLIMTVIALLLGLHLVAAIGGGDMPVVVSMLNSYSGWAAAAAGFMLSNNLLIITGALVGSSGAILSYIMCKAMNRSFIAVILGGFGTEAGHLDRRSGPRRVPRDHRRRPGRTARRGAVGRDRPRLRHGGRQGAEPGRGTHREAAATWARTCGSPCTRSPAGCPGT